MYKRLRHCVQLSIFVAKNPNITLTLKLVILKHFLQIHRCLIFWGQESHHSHTGLVYLPTWKPYKSTIHVGNWLVGSTHLKNISQNGNLPQMGVKIKYIWNHHLGKYTIVPWILWESYGYHFENLHTTCNINKFIPSHYEKHRSMPRLQG